MPVAGFRPPFASRARSQRVGGRPSTSATNRRWGKARALRGVRVARPHRKARVPRAHSSLARTSCGESAHVPTVGGASGQITAPYCTRIGPIVLLLAEIPLDAYAFDGANQLIAPESHLTRLLLMQSTKKWVPVSFGLQEAGPYFWPPVVKKITLMCSMALHSRLAAIYWTQFPMEPMIGCRSSFTHRTAIFFEHLVHRYTCGVSPSVCKILNWTYFALRFNVELCIQIDAPTAPILSSQMSETLDETQWDQAALQSCSKSVLERLPSGRERPRAMAANQNAR